MINRGPQTFYVTSTIKATVPVQRPLKPDGTPERTRITVQTPIQIPVFTSEGPESESRFSSTFDVALNRFEEMVQSADPSDVSLMMEGARRFAKLIQMMASEAASSSDATSKSIVIE